ncbi:MAG: type II toxin-antitoxin system HicA family toxin [Chloroflexi bacterium]|nr:type II toxin-antitoxin system HicA family toxin [Chloroflexota bacterium]
MPRLPRVSGKEVIRILERHDFGLSRVRGSHYIYRHKKTGTPVVIPVHRDRVIPPGTLMNILRQIGVDAETFARWLQD